MQTVRAPEERALAAISTMIGAAAGSGDGQEQLILEMQPFAIDACDAWSRGRDRHAEIALDQMLPERCGMGRTAACACHHDLRGPPLQTRGKFRNGLRQRLVLPHHGPRRLAYLARHLRAAFRIRRLLYCRIPRE